MMRYRAVIGRLAKGVFPSLGLASVAACGLGLEHRFLRLFTASIEFGPEGWIAGFQGVDTS